MLVSEFILSDTENNFELEEKRAQQSTSTTSETYPTLTLQEVEAMLSLSPSCAEHMITEFFI